MDVESFMGNMEGALKPVKVLTKQRRIAELAMVVIAKESVVNQPNRTKLHREEPDASIAHVRVCEGWGWQHPRLLGDQGPLQERPSDLNVISCFCLMQRQEKVLQ